MSPQARHNVRSGAHNAAVPQDRLSLVSLYAGAGGLDLGFVRAGFEPIWAIEADADAVATYRANLGDHIVEGTLPRTEPPDTLRPDVVIGGPPCQGFSVIGRMNPQDPRSVHVFHLVDVAARLKARAFVLENVKALATSKRWAAVRDALIDHAHAQGYSTQLLVLNAAHFGVPQARERMFLIGLVEPSELTLRRVTLARPATVREALSRIPPYGAPGNDGLCRARVVPATTPVMRPSPYRGSLLFNGSGRPLPLDEPAKTLPASMGGNGTPIIDQDELDFGSEPWVVDYHARLAKGRKPLRRAPDRMRRLTIQEAAALQTFPATWEFTGPQVAQYRQIGNAVPPKLAFHVARAVWRSLNSGIDAQPVAEAAIAA